MVNVIIYSTPTCGWCRVAKQFFDAHNVPYIEKDVARDIDARQEMINKTGQLGVPVIDIDGEVMVGYNQNRLAELLQIA